MSTRGFITCCEALNWSFDREAGFSMLRPPKQAGKEKKCLCVSLRVSSPLSFGSKMVVIEFSMGSSR